MFSFFIPLVSPTPFPPTSWQCPDNFLGKTPVFSALHQEWPSATRILRTGTRGAYMEEQSQSIHTHTLTLSDPDRTLH